MNIKKRLLELKSLNELFTPCLILDEYKFTKNVERLKSIVEQKNINFRPHLKTAKCIEITKRFSEAFGKRAVVSTIEEIEKLKYCGINDFLYSVAIVPNKFDRIARCLSEDCKISVLVDDISIARELVDFYKASPPVTALAPKIGYDKAAYIAKTAHKNGTTLKQEVIKSGLIKENEYDKIMNPIKMTKPK